MKLILASSSPYRKRLLERLQLPFDTIHPKVDESPLPEELPTELATRLAIDKAAAIARQHPDAAIIGSDQVACLDRELLGKPGDTETAFRQLRSCSGRSVSFYTGLCVIAPGVEKHAVSVPFTVHFRELTDAEIRRYLELDQPLDCAGSFKCESLGISLFEKMDGEDPTALEGLPLIALTKILGAIGMHPLSGGRLS